MERASPLDCVIQHKRAAGHAFARRNSQDRGLITLRTANPQGMSVQQGLDRFRQITIGLEIAEILALQRMQFRLERPTNGPLNAVELLLQSTQDSLALPSRDQVSRSGCIGRFGDWIQDKASEV